jgi:hypothetical protein
MTLLAVGCGDPQFDQQYRGDSLWSFQGTLTLGGPNMNVSGPLQVALFWSPQGPDVTDFDEWVEQRGTTTAVQLSIPFVLNAYDAPGPEHMLLLPDGTPAGYATGRMLVYVDQDSDGRHTPGEPFVGLNGRYGFYYAPTPVAAGKNPTYGTLASGFHQVLLPQPCGFMPPPPTASDSCGVKLGSSCRYDMDCMPGLCLNSTNLAWPAGYCTIPDPPLDGCYPGRGVYVGIPHFGLFTPLLKYGFYLKACSSDADCQEMMRPSKDAYFCDAGLQGCVPNDHGNISVGPIQIEPFCIQHP